MGKKSADWLAGYQAGVLHGKDLFRPTRESPVSCPECGITFKRVTEHLKKIHGYLYVNNVLTSPEDQRK